MHDKRNFNWYLLYCKPRQDALAEENLLGQNFEVYRPCIGNAKERSDGKTSFSLPSLFPRYLFIRMVLGKDDFQAAKYTRGVSNFVAFGKKYACVDDCLIKHIRSLEEQYRRSDSYSGNISEGQKVSIDHRAFQGIDAIFMERNSENRALMLLDIMGRKVKMAVDYGVLVGS